MARPRRLLRLPVLAAAASLSVSVLAGAMPAAASAVHGPPSGITPGGPAGPAALGEHLIRRAHAEGAANSVTDYTSINWAGYFATAASHGKDFTAVSAEWVQSAVTCTKTNAWASFWVGLDGWWNGSVEQGGSEAHCLHGTASYNVWWEMFPHNEIQTSFAISPGDTIQASVTYVTSSKDFDIVVQDVSTGQTLTKDTPCLSGQGGCMRSSAEVISEDVGGGSAPDGLYYLPDYRTQMYATASVTDIHGHTGTLSNSNWQLGDITEVSSKGITKQTTSALDPTGSNFTTTWHHQ